MIITRVIVATPSGRRRIVCHVEYRSPTLFPRNKAGPPRTNQSGHGDDQLVLPTDTFAVV